LPKVNRELAARLLSGGGADSVDSDEETIEAPSGGAKKDVQRKKLNTSLLKDDRFSAIFKNEVSLLFLEILAFSLFRVKPYG
jgi:hypothetical protein